MSPGHFLNIFTYLNNNAGVWIVPIPRLIFNYPSPFSKLLVGEVLPSTPTAICIAVTLMFYSFSVLWQDVNISITKSQRILGCDFLRQVLVCTYLSVCQVSISFVTISFVTIASSLIFLFCQFATLTYNVINVSSLSLHNLHFFFTLI